MGSASLNTAARAPRDSSRISIVFAGIHFELEGPEELLRTFTQVPFALLSAAATDVFSAPVQKLTCVLSGPSSSPIGSPTLGSRAVEWEWADGQEGVATARLARARWSSGPRGLVGTASLSEVSPRAAESLLTSLSAALLHRAGGALLHAASVELPAGVVAFIGPSGAGKSTACEHVVGARQFSLDRLAAVPVGPPGRGQRWAAHPFPGGTPCVRALPPSIALGRPLLAILRVEKAAHGCELKRCAESRGLALLRAAAFHAHRRPEAEGELLAHLERLARQVPVAELHLSLGTSLEPILSRWLSEVEQKRGEPEEAFAEQERRHVGA